MVLWAGSPSLRGLIGPAMALPVMAGLVFGTIVPQAAVLFRPDLAPFAGVLGLAVGALMFVGQAYTLVMYRRRSVFVLTDQRVAFRLRHWGPLALLLSRSVPLSELEDPELTQRSTRDDIIRFTDSAFLARLWVDWLGFPGWPHPPVRTAYFLVREDAEQVFQLASDAVGAARAAAPQELPDAHHDQ